MAKRYNILTRCLAALALLFVYVASTSAILVGGTTTSALARGGRGGGGFRGGGGRGFYRGGGRDFKNHPGCKVLYCRDGFSSRRAAREGGGRPAGTSKRGFLAWLS